MSLIALHIIFSLSLAGICDSVSEAVVRSRAERDGGTEWETVCGDASRPGTGERKLQEAGGHSALSPRSQHSTTFSGTSATGLHTSEYI